jgi:hypothetical protein
MCRIFASIISNGDKPQGLRLNVESGASQVHGQPNSLFDGPERIPFSGVKDPGFSRGLKEGLDSPRAVKSEKLRNRHVQELSQGKAAEPLSRRVGIQQLMAVRVEQKQCVPGLFEESLRQPFQMIVIHGKNLPFHLSNPKRHFLSFDRFLVARSRVQPYTSLQALRTRCKASQN